MNTTLEYFGSFTILYPPPPYWIIPAIKLFSTICLVPTKNHCNAPQHLCQSWFIFTDNISQMKNISLSSSTIFFRRKIFLFLHRHYLSNEKYFSVFKYFAVFTDIISLLQKKQFSVSTTSDRSPCSFFSSCSWFLSKSLHLTCNELFWIMLNMFMINVHIHMCALNVHYNTCLTDMHYVARAVFVAFPCIAVPEGWTGGQRGPLPLNKRSRWC